MTRRKQIILSSTFSHHLQHLLLRSLLATRRMAFEVSFYTQDGLEQVITADTRDLRAHGTFVRANCHKGQVIVYNNIDYNPNSLSTDRWQILEPGQGVVNLTTQPALSVRGVKSFGEKGVTLYKHVGYGGDELVLFNEDRNLKFGVSSMIISGGSWTIYSMPDFQGASKTWGYGQYPTSTDMGIGNDLMRSIKMNSMQKS